MSKNTLRSIFATFLFTFFSSLAVVGGGVLLASVFIPDSFIYQYGLDDMNYTQEEWKEITKKNSDFLKAPSAYTAVPSHTSMPTVTPLPHFSVTPSKKPYSRKTYEVYFEKLKKRARILQAKNNLLEEPIEIDNVVWCLQNISFEKFQNFSESPKKAFSNALGYCSFIDFSQQVQDAIERKMKEKKKKEVQARVHSFHGVVVPQSVINSVLNIANWDKQTRTLLGNQQNIYHDITYLHNPDLDILGIKELVGVGLSKYPHSSRSRKKNLRNAASKLDGKIIHPGETLSIVNALSPFNYKNGYVNGIIIKDGKNVTAMGGGVCQAVTTMFRSWQNAGLEVVKFQPHSKSISYYGGIGFDATMFKSNWSGGNVDLLLRNNSDHSILIKVVDSDPYQMIFLYGTRDRKVVLKRYHFSRYKGNQVAKWKRSIQYGNAGEWVNDFFQEWQKLY